MRIVAVDLIALCTAVLLLGAQCAPKHPARVTFDSLRASAAAIDSYRADYEAAFEAGHLTGEQKARLDRAYNKANDSIIAATRALRAGVVAESPDQLVTELINLVITLIPPKDNAP